MQQDKFNWDKLDWRAWEFEGQKLANPLLIIWRVIVLPFYIISLLLFCLFVALAHSNVQSKDILSEYWPL